MSDGDDITPDPAAPDPVGAAATGAQGAAASDAPDAHDAATTGQPYGAGPAVDAQHVRPQADIGDLAPSHGGGPLGRFKKQYGKHPAHLVGHVIVIAITGYVLSIIFKPIYGPQPLNLALWLLGGAVLHDGVFLPLYGVINALFMRAVGAGDKTSLKDLAMGPPAPADAPAPTYAPPPPTRDQLRRVPIINFIRTPLVISVVLFLVFLPRILNRQTQNFVNALGHQPPDFMMRWVWVTLGLFVASALIYAVRWLRGPRPARDAPSPASPSPGSATPGS